jgi:UDPglucose 6-dehydrogenase
MRVGFVGLGKLGLPVALALALRGHDVIGYDVDPRKMQKVRFPHQEVGPNGEPSIEPLLQTSTVSLGRLPELVRHSDLIFVAVQTPHAAPFEGVTRLPAERADFDYCYLKSAVSALASQVEDRDAKTLVIISTVLPGTTRREILPLLPPHVKLCYNPLFVAMGSVMPDFLQPELVLLGADDQATLDQVESFYGTLTSRPCFRTTVENAELIKMAYNTYISTKISFANTLMELCHRLPNTDVDAVTDALALADTRLMSPRYLRGGMGDGGGCHPRDNIALSWLAGRLGLSYDWFGQVMQCREDQTTWLVDLVEAHHRRRGYPHRRVGLYGRAFKGGTNVVDGSPATLLANLLTERGFEVASYDPSVDPGPCPFESAGIYVVATRHPEFADPSWRFPPGSVVLDPWRYLPKQAGVEIVPLGVGPALTAST